jgi:transposase-like protein
MGCPYCNSNDIKTLKNKTNLGYPQYFCIDCCHQYNERTETKFNFIEPPNEVVTLTTFLLSI